MFYFLVLENNRSVAQTRLGTAALKNGSRYSSRWFNAVISELCFHTSEGAKLTLVINVVTDADGG